MQPFTLCASSPIGVFGLLCGRMYRSQRLDGLKCMDDWKYSLQRTAMSRIFMMNLTFALLIPFNPYSVFARRQKPNYSYGEDLSRVSDPFVSFDSMTKSGAIRSSSREHVRRRWRKGSVIRCDANELPVFLTGHFHKSPGEIGWTTPSG